MSHTLDTIDFRSDTVTRPTAEMLEAMQRASVGDDVYGEDPAVNALQEETADLLGKAAALFMPSGTMANQIAIHLHCPRGSSILCEEDSHVFLYEAGAAAAQSGVQFDFVPLDFEGLSRSSNKAAFNVGAWILEFEKRVRSPGLHEAETSLIVLENTHNRGLGRCLAAQEIAQIRNLVDKLQSKNHPVKLHCDGARLWNAAVALGVKERELAKSFDSVSVCLSKGLGAPVGSLLVGEKALIEKARKIRKRWGGGMRQVGYLAEAGRFALKHHRQRLTEDHTKAERLAIFFEGFLASGVLKAVYYPLVGTNIVYLDMDVQRADYFVETMKKKGVRLSHLGRGRLRLVTHLDITDKSFDRALNQLGSVLHSGLNLSI